MSFLTTAEVAKMWGITSRRVQILCERGMIEGAVKFGRSWAIPADVARPEDHRTKEYRALRKKQNETEKQ